MEEQIIESEINKISKCIPSLSGKELDIIRESLESCYDSGYCDGYAGCEYDMNR